MSTLEILTSAIKNKKIVLIKKYGEPLFRKIEPYILYYGLVSGEDVNLNGWQTSNQNDLTDKSGWRNFNIEEISEVKTTKEDFARRKDFNPNGEMYEKGILVSVDC